MWLSVTFEAEAAHAEALADALMEAGALSVSLEDAQAGTPFETPQFGEPGSLATPIWNKSRVLALFEPVPELRERVFAALRVVEMAELPNIAFTEVAEQDWVRLTQSQFEPIRISERLWIVPSWHVAPDASAINLQLDPGLAFGTGSHPTTRLCLEWIENSVFPGCTVLDYGCGSGILGIAAKKVGADKTVGVDIDPAALAAATENAEKNGVSLELVYPGEALEGRFDLVIANILSNPLKLLAPLLAGYVRPGGRIALSGVLETQADELIAAYAPYLSLSIGAVREGWVRLDGQAKLVAC